MSSLARSLKSSRLRAYAAYTRSPLQSVLSILPALILYELGLFFFNQSDITGIRNGADVLMRHFYALFGLYGFYAFAASLVLALGITFWVEHHGHGRIAIEPLYYLWMVGESLLYGAILFIVLSKVASINIRIPPLFEPSVWQRVVLALGAGIYEEFVFRVIAVSGVAALVSLGLNWSKTGAYALGVLVSSVVFAWFHYVGVYGDVFQVRTFLLRTLAGVLLSVLYVLRGFGITAYAHIVYDFIIIFFV